MGESAFLQDPLPAEWFFTLNFWGDGNPRKIEQLICTQWKMEETSYAFFFPN